MIKLSNISQYNRNILKMITGTSLAQAIPIAVTPIITRIYSPSEFGVYVLFLSIVTILAVVSAGRYEQAIMLPVKEEDAFSIMVLSFIIILIFNALISIPLFVYSQNISDLLDNQEIESWLILIPVAVTLTSLYNSINFWLNRKGQYSVIAKNKIIQSGSISITQVTSGKINYTDVGLIYGWLISQFISLIYISSNLKGYMNKNISLEKIFLVARRYKEFPTINIWSSLLNAGSINIPVVLFSIFLSAPIVGFFSLATRILQMPMVIIGSSISQVYFENLSKIKDEELEVKNLSLNLFTSLIMISTIPTIIIILYGPQLFSIVFGEDWMESGKYAQALSVWIFFVFITSPLTHIITVYEKHTEFLLFNLVLFVTRLLAILFGCYYLEDPLLIVYIYGLLGALIWCIFLYYVLELIGVNFYQITMRLLIPLILIITTTILNFL